MIRLATFVALLGACTATPLSSTEQEIIGGTRSTGMGATVLLAGYPANKSVLTTCTAVVVSPTVLLTAAHCVDAPNHPNYLFGVFTGDDAAAYGTLVALEPHLLPAASVHPHPQYVTTAPFLADLGVVVMASPLTITPIPMHRAAIDQTIVGKQAQIVGYGQTTYQQPNQTRFEALTTVTAIEADTIVVGDATHHGCLGDSGGPAIVDGVLVGIDSYGPVGCTGAAHYRRVDTYQPFIETYVPAPPSPDAGPVGPGPDAGTTDPSDGGGCATSGSGAGLGLGLVGLLGLRRRRAR